MKEEFLSHFQTALPFWVIVMRLLFALLMGAALGIEREWRERPAGLRTHIIVCVASATFAIVSVEMLMQPIFHGDYIRADPNRLIEAITNGVAFLAAGFIVFFKGEVHGVTTGAGMWLAAAIGLSSGLGLFSLSILATVLGVLTLTIIRRMELGLDLKDGDRSNTPNSAARRGATGED